MSYKSIDPEKQCCAFGFFDMEGNLIGYRQDTFNTVGTDFAKIYRYSESQVKTVMDNINSSVTKDVNMVAEILKKCGYVGKEVTQISNNERNNRNLLKRAKQFEVRVLPAPEKEPMEPVDLTMWLMEAPGLEPIETYKFNL